MLDEDLLHAPGGAAHLATPALVVDLDALERNIASMAALTRAKGIALRPHAKTHKSAEIAKRQIAAGAVGLCCAKLGEAEALAEKGIANLLVTAPLAAPQALRRLARLNANTEGLTVVIDNPAMVAALSGTARQSGRPLSVLVDLDVGLHRTGILPGEAATALAQDVAAAEDLVFDGLQAYAGQIMHEGDAGVRRSKAEAIAGKVAAQRDALIAVNLPPKIVSGGGTGTVDIDPDLGVFTELQAGSYVFMDREYNDVWTKTGARPPFETALFVRTTVISTTLPQLATTDAGLKAFAADAGPPVILRGAGPSASYFLFGDEQGGVLCEKPQDRPEHGATLDCTVPHCDPTVNLYDAYRVVRGGTLVAIWPVDARGRSQ
jgi:D-serine deaminase-like pyridoxal phosphate-dependent protein